jgi:ABC-type glycerol-3-phosphate transport system substrate-binding protein
MSLVRTAALATLLLAAGCQSPQPKTQAGAGPDIAAEVTRICALPGGEREQALEKLKQDSGMVLFCGAKE